MVRTTLLIAMLLASSPCALAEISMIELDLPHDIEWTKVNEQSDADRYLREWIPTGATLEDPDLWLIVEQRFALERKTSAKRFIRNLMNNWRASCTDVRYNGPEKIKVETHNTYWIRVFCANQHNKPYGSISEQRVIAEGKTVFVVTSELRTSPTTVAGVFSFEEDGSAREFWQRFAKSTSVTRESVKIVERPKP